MMVAGYHPTHGMHTGTVRSETPAKVLFVTQSQSFSISV